MLEREFDSETGEDNIKLGREFHGLKHENVQSVKFNDQEIKRLKVKLLGPYAQVGLYYRLGDWGNQ